MCNYYLRPYLSAETSVFAGYSQRPAEPPVAALLPPCDGHQPENPHTHTHKKKNCDAVQGLGFVKDSDLLHVATSCRDCGTSDYGVSSNRVWRAAWDVKEQVLVHRDFRFQFHQRISSC